MLSRASIDIDQEAHGDYEKGHIRVDDAEDVEGDEDELEEVDVETYEDAENKRGHQARRTSNYTEVEDEALI
jgi:hypothetical protein